MRKYNRFSPKNIVCPSNTSSSYVIKSFPPVYKYNYPVTTFIVIINTFPTFCGKYSDYYTRHSIGSKSMHINLITKYHVYSNYISSSHHNPCVWYDRRS